ncbi:ribokinase [Lachnospiraceae bacterium]|jgi:ribokinase|nr:ribokinase [Lachnospiraceae bacterium]
MRILDFGSLNYDYVYGVDHVAVAGETISSYNMEVFCGGKGLNQAIAAARAGAEVYMAGLVGEDGQLLMDICKRNGVDSSFIRKVPGISGHAIIQVDKEGQNSILLYGGSNQQMTREYIDDVLGQFGCGDILLIQNEINLLDYIIDKASENGMRIYLNPSPYNEKIKSCDLSKISVLLINEIEGGQISGERDYDKMLDVMQEKYPETDLMLTLGEKGAVYCCRGKRYRQDIYKVKAVDTTAAGDTFTGYFAALMQEKIPVQEVLAMCAGAAAIAVSRKGAANSIPIRDEVNKFCLHK